MAHRACGLAAPPSSPTGSGITVSVIDSGNDFRHLLDGDLADGFGVLWGDNLLRGTNIVRGNSWRWGF
jgi:hypothetical protein